MDAVGGVEKIVKLALRIKDAADTVRQNKEQCRQIRKGASRVSSILSRLPETGTMNDPATRDALEDLEEALECALKHVRACQQERNTVCLLCTARKQSKQLRRVQDDICQKVMVVVLAVNIQITMILRFPQPPVHTGGNFIQPEADPIIEHHHHVCELGSMDSPEFPSPASAMSAESDNDGFQLVMGTVEPNASTAGVKSFSLSELDAATHHFSEETLIGRGAFSAVYKGVLHDRLVVAIKKFQHPYQVSVMHNLSKLDLFSKLQHQNIVKFIGYAIGGKVQVEERDYFLVEEYISNGTLDNIICGPPLLDWSSLFRIIQGIANGLHYLHDQRFVHLDLKPNNILLSSQMNPKITDFGTAIILDHSDDHTTSNVTVAGTLGYMAPEYIMEGTISTKCDVYGFGVTLLETISGMCRSEPARGQTSIVWAWEARPLKESSGRSLYEKSQLKELNRCIGVGLLCTQFKPEDRPTMPEVLEMLNGKKRMPAAKKPRFITGRRV